MRAAARVASQQSDSTSGWRGIAASRRLNDPQKRLRRATQACRSESLCCHPSSKEQDVRMRTSPPPQTWLEMRALAVEAVKGTDVRQGGREGMGNS